MRRQRTRDVLACLSLSALCFSQARSETLFLTGWDFYSRVPLGVPTILALTPALGRFRAVGGGPKWRPVDPAPRAQPARSLRRVVWLMFDELDQRITFEARPPGLELPELDRLRRESLYADAARPPAGT